MLLVTLLPSQAFAIPPAPDRSGVPLEKLQQDQVTEGTNENVALTGRVFRVPARSEDAPDDTVAAPAGGSGQVDFSSALTTAAYSATTESPTTADAAPAAPRQAGQLPVALGQAAGAPQPTGTWQVQLYDRTDPLTEGIDGALMVVTAPSTGAVPVDVRLDYRAFQNLYGADWASRLEFVQLPECYLTDPANEDCNTPRELESVNDTDAKTVSAVIDTAADGTVSQTSARTHPSTESRAGVAQASYADFTAATGGDKAVVGVRDSGSGEAGSFKATPLSPSGKWAGGGSSGAFSYSYPLQVPPTPAGPKPAVAFEYSSQAVDGKTAVTSPQASWIGEGWNYDPGHIERRYRSCQDDRKANADGTANNATHKTSDLCWVSYNAVMSLGGRTTELVRVGSTNIYRPQTDDGTRVELKTGADNGDDNGEYWVVTTPDGTRYYYGLNKIGGGHDDSRSVFTVPVFGNHPKEPCNKSAFADSRCPQAWHWGLDKVVDTKGNTMIVNWKQESNYYAADNKLTKLVEYVRGGYPLSIEYGLRPDKLTSPSAKIVFEAKERCLKSETACDPANFDKTKDPAAYQPWWDSPGNLNCLQTSKKCATFPSFWTRRRLDAVTTQAARPGVIGLAAVDRYELDQSFPRDWYDTSPSLWLNSITHWAYSPGDTKGKKMPPVTFSAYTVDSTDPLGDYLADKHLPNLVPRANGTKRPGFTRPRIGTVTTEAGAEINVTYDGGCKAEPDIAPQNNHGTCFPVRWSPDGEEDKPALAWFNKYVVAKVVEHDKVSTNGRDITTSYSYDNAAWAKDDDEFSKPELRTYSVWLGYQKVTAFKGDAASGPDAAQTQSKSITRYFRGAGGALKDSTGTYELAEDRPEFAGMPAETLTYASSAGGAKVLKRTLTFPDSKQTASRDRDGGLDPLKAHRVWTRRADSIQNIGSSWRSVRTETEVDPDYGLPVKTETSVVKPEGTAEKHSDYTCAKSEYVNNNDPEHGVYLIGLPKETRTTATPCSQVDSTPASQLISATRNAYDSKELGALPTEGLPTTRWTNDGKGTGWIRDTRITYDSLGRIHTSTDADDQVTTTDYTPADGGPVTSIKVTKPLQARVTQTLDPGRGTVLTSTDANNRVTRSEFDAFGRLAKGWLPARSSGSQSPNVQISYQMASGEQPTAVTVQSLRDDDGYDTQVTLYDGLLRTIQTQSPATGPGRIITGTKYNDHGLVSEQQDSYLAGGAPQTRQFKPKSELAIPRSSTTAYDGLERPVKATTVQSGNPVYSSTIEYGDDYTLTKPAGGAQPPTKTWTDALGRVARIQHYTKSDLSQWRDTTYDYDPRGNLLTATDEPGNVWTYHYDARGRLMDQTDPDTGTSSFDYDDLDRRTMAKDANQKAVYTEYDALGRTRATREGSPDAAPTREWTYDTLPGALGQLVSSVRHDASGDYTTRITGYTTDYRPTGREVTIPDNSLTKGLAKTYTYAYTYTATGKPFTATLPETAGGLGKETVYTRYNRYGLPVSLSGLSWYTADISYSPYGEALQTVSGPQPYRVWTTNFIDDHTGRLQRTVWDRETDGPNRVADTYYSYDTAGNVTSVASQTQTATAKAWDTQCFTYDQLGELVHAWTSTLTPDGNFKGCKAANGTTWGYASTGQRSAGPIANAPDSQSDATAPDDALKASLGNAAPDTTTVATGSAATYWDSYTFDAIGNRATQVQHATGTGLNTAQDITRTYGYGKQNTVGGTPAVLQPHTLTQTIAVQGSGTSTTQDYAYDAAGNTTDRPGLDLHWTAEEKLATATTSGSTTRYVYDADGNRLLQHSDSGTTLYLGETEITTDANGSAVNAARSYALAGAPAVVRTTNGSSTAHKLSVLLHDRLGSATTAVELAKDQTVTRRAFKPYGEIRGTKPTSWPNQHSYLGVGIDDTNTGLTHLGAREYDQSTGRFISADPVIAITDPLQMNGYAYSSNNPVTKSDPTGLCPKDICDGYGQNTAATPFQPTGGGGNGQGSGDSNTVVRNGGVTNLPTSCAVAQSNAHDAAVCASGFSAKKWADDHHIDGYVTVDIGIGGSIANKIPGAKADGSGKVGYADVILWTKERVYIWEVKPSASENPDPKNKKAVDAHNYAFKKGPEQLGRYVDKLQDVLDDAGDDREVLKGPAISSAVFFYGAKGNRGRVWSKDSYSGMRYYGTDRDDKKKATPSPSPGPDMTAAPRATAEPSAQPTPSATGFYSTAPPGERSWMGSDVGMVVSAFSGIFIVGAPYEAAVGGGAVVLYELAA
ncbi:RHS repeat domain-containing protein [Streptomyces sp. NPDC002144]